MSNLMEPQANTAADRSRLLLIFHLIYLAFDNMDYNHLTFIYDPVLEAARRIMTYILDSCLFHVGVDSITTSSSYSAALYASLLPPPFLALFSFNLFFASLRRNIFYSTISRTTTNKLTKLRDKTTKQLIWQPQSWIRSHPVPNKPTPKFDRILHLIWLALNDSKQDQVSDILCYSKSRSLPHAHQLIRLFRFLLFLKGRQWQWSI